MILTALQHVSGYLMPKGKGIPLIVIHIYISCVVVSRKTFSITYMVFLSNTNDLSTVVWFQVFLSNTNYL